MTTTTTNPNAGLLDPESYVEPEPEFIWLEHDVLVEQVQPGNRLLEWIVGERKTGPKWTTLLTDDGKKIARLTNGTTVQVERQQMTEPNREERRRARRNQALLERLQTRNNGVAAARERMDKQLNEHGYADSYRVAALLDAQALNAVWAEFESYALAVSAEGFEGSFRGDLVDLEELFCNRLRAKLCEPSTNRALSRNGSVVENLLNDCQREAMATFLDTWRWS